MNRLLLPVTLSAVLTLASTAIAAPANQSSGGSSVTMSGRNGGSGNPEIGNVPGFSTAVLIAAAPSAFSSIASLTLGPTKIASAKPWWSVIGAVSGAVAISSGIAFYAANKANPQLGTPYLITGLVTGLPSLGLAVYSWAARAPVPQAKIEVLSHNDVTLTPPSLGVVVSPSGAAGPSVALLNGRF